MSLFYIHICDPDSGELVHINSHKIRAGDGPAALREFKLAYRFKAHHMSRWKIRAVRCGPQ